MALLSPLALFAGLVIPVIILLYMLKKRTRPKTVSSIMLWLRLERSSAPALRVSKLLRSLLLALQLLAAAVLVLALARPVLNLTSGTSRTAIIIFDTSMSMAVAESGSTRLEKAVSQAKGLVNGKAPGDRIALIAMGEEASVLSGFSADGSALLQALAQVGISSARANPAAALALAANMAAAEEGADILLFSDGIFGNLVRPPDSLDFIVLGSPEVKNLVLENVVPDGDRLYVSVYNNGTEPAEAVVAVKDRAGAIIGRRDLALDPDQRRILVWRNLPASPWYKAEIISDADQLALDNEYFALAAEPAPSKLLLVSPGNLFLERGLLLYPGLSVSRVAPESYSSGMAELYDLYVFDGFLPPELPQAPVLVFDPPHPNPHFATGPPVSAASLRPLPHPLITHVDFSEVSIGFGKTVVGGNGLLETDQGLLATEFEYQGLPLVVFGFAIQAGDLPLRPAFPILLRNILDRFAGSGQQAVPLGFGQPVPGRGTRVYAEHTGSPAELAPGTRMLPGIYTFVSEGEERITPVNPPLYTGSLAARPELDSPAGAVAGLHRAVGGKPLLWPLILVALILVSLEWWVDNYGS